MNCPECNYPMTSKEGKIWDCLPCGESWAKVIQLKPKKAGT